MATSQRRHFARLGLLVTLLCLGPVALVSRAGTQTDVGFGEHVFDSVDLTEPSRGDDTRLATTRSRLPSRAGQFAPSFMAEADGETLDAERLAETESCGACHGELVQQWQSSSHALASFSNPYYRLAVDRLRDATSFEASLHCGGCHDVALMPNGAMLTEIDPTSELAHAGVGCRTCHGIESVRPDGNGSFTLATRPIRLPVDGHDRSLEEHRADTTPTPLGSAQLCMSCHRGFLGPEIGNEHYLIGMDDASAWAGSGYAQNPIARIDEPVAAQTCAGCHMPEVDGYRSHAFAGAQTSLAASRNDGVQLARHQAMLQTAVTLDIAALWSGSRPTVPIEGAAIEPGATYRLDVVIRNVGVGHRFPAGTLDAQDTWLEVEIFDAAGDRIAEAGLEHETQPDGRDDPTAHILRAEPLDAEGQPIETHDTWRMFPAAWNQTIGPRDAAVIRYQVSFPPELAPEQLPLRVEARLRHRRHRLSLHELACEMSRDPVGIALAEGSLTFTGAASDVCSPQPITELATATTYLGAAAPDGWEPAQETWRRLFNHSLGLLHQVQERLDEARPGLEQALGMRRADGSARERAMLLYVLAAVEGRQGRTDVALSILDEVAQLVPDHPAVDFRRGLALAQVWRWDEATEAFGRVTAAVPHADLAWRWYARSLGSAGRDEEALAAALEGLRLQPRDPNMLLTQSVALRALEADSVEVEAARDAYLEHRDYDFAQQLQLRCFQEVDGCSQRRQPVPVYQMRTAHADTDESSL